MPLFVGLQSVLLRQCYTIKNKTEVRTEPEKGHWGSLHAPSVSGVGANPLTRNVPEPEAQQLLSIDGPFPITFPLTKRVSNMSAPEVVGFSDTHSHQTPVKTCSSLKSISIPPPSP